MSHSVDQMMEGAASDAQTIVRPFVMNRWYLAAWSPEVQAGASLKRTLLGQQVLLLRAENGEVAAIGNRCPHRFASLGNGRFEAGVVQCPYHGLSFDMKGHCVHNPHGDGVIPDRAKVPSYPLVERYGALWLWPGESEAADPETIPDVSFLDRVPPTDRGLGYLNTKANYELMSDNIMDLSHIDFVHLTTLSTEGELSATKVKARLNGDVVTAQWSVTGKGMVKDRELRKGALVTTTYDVTWHPVGVMALRVESNPVDTEGDSILELSVHIMTPETENTTHYFFETGQGGQKEGVEIMLNVFRDEDGAMLEEVQENMEDQEFWSLNPLILTHDTAAVMARRVVQRLKRQEIGDRLGAGAL